MTKVEIYRKEFGVRLNKLLETKNVSQTTLGKMIGVDKTTITKYINEEFRVPKIDTFLAICKALNVSTDYFLNEDISEYQSYKIPEDPYSILRSIIVLIRNKVIVQDPDDGQFRLNFNCSTYTAFCNDVMRFEGSKLKSVDKIIYELIDDYKNELATWLFNHYFDNNLPF